MSVRQARTYFHREKPIHRLPRDLVTGYDRSQSTDDELVLMKAGAAKDRHAVRRLFERYKGLTAAQILPLLPRPTVTPLSVRVMNWLRRLEGSSEHDPLDNEIRLLKRHETFTIRHGYAETKLK